MVRMQLFWDFAAVEARLTWNGSSSETPDLDIVALVFDKYGFVLDCCFWGHRSTSGNALVHSGDCRPGVASPSQSSSGRNEECIVVDIARLPPHQHSVALCVVSASGQPLGVANAAEVSLTAFPTLSSRPAVMAAASPSKRRPGTAFAPIKNTSFPY
jgi:stress response protein SCP2